MNQDPGFTFGRPARPLWSLLEEGVFLNHGSFGACPLAVQKEQSRIRREMEEQPDLFFQQRIVPSSPDTELRVAARALGAFAGAGDRIALVENATTGIQAVLQSLSFTAGDQILITDHQYNAVRLAVETRCKETGASPCIARIPLPTSPAEVLSRISDAVGPKVKLAIIDHITSPTALVFPIQQIVAQLQARGIPVLVDGAHVVGQMPLDVNALGSTWYVSNAHKWLFVPRGTAFLSASAEAAPKTRPTITSHFAELGFPQSFDYIGTRDYSAWLAIPAALAFLRKLDPEKLWSYNAGLVEAGSTYLMAAGARPIAPLEMCGAMRSFILPQRRVAVEDDASALRRMLWDEERIQVAVNVLFGVLLLRISAQAYVGKEDLAQLGEALERRGWPGR